MAGGEGRGWKEGMINRTVNVICARKQPKSASLFVRMVRQRAPEKVDVRVQSLKREGVAVFNRFTS